MHKIIFILTVLFSNLSALELDRVILSSNGNLLYLEFWPIVAPVWKSMGLKPTLALIANENIQIDTTIGDVIRFTPIEGVPESLQAQVIRLLLPILFPEDGCLIADIDMIPISKSYFFQGSFLYTDDSFIVYRNKAKGYENGGRFPICYLAAKGKIFQQIFNISNYEDIPKLITNWAQKKYGWNTDEIIAFIYAKAWEKNGGNLICLNHEVELRLDRSCWNIDFNTLEISKYIDCHCPRPYSSYKNSIDQLVQIILEAQ